MVRKNPVKATVQPVTDDQMSTARQAAEQAAADLAEVEHGDPLQANWASEYESATAAARITARRLEQLEEQRAEHVEQLRQRVAVAKSAAPEVKAMAEALGASRDKLAVTAADHLRMLAELATLAGEHNTLLASYRARLAELGLSADGDHAEGTLGSGRSAGIRAAGTDWLAVPADGVVWSALRQVFPSTGPRHPFHEMPGDYLWMPSQVARRADGLGMPTLDGIKATVPVVPQPVKAQMADIKPAAKGR